MNHTVTASPVNETEKEPLVLSVAVIAISFAASLLKAGLPTPRHRRPAPRSPHAYSADLLAARKVHGQEFLTWAMLGGVCYAVHFGAWVWSLNLTSIAASVTLVTATPLILGIAGWLFGKDQPSRRLWIALALSVLGVMIISAGTIGGGPGSQIGNALAFLGALAMAGYLLVARRLRAHSPLLLLAIATATGGLLLLTIAIATGTSIVPVSTESFFWIIMATLIPQLIGHTALTYSLKSAPPTTAAMATVAEPVGATAIAWFLLAESVGLLVMLGSAVTLCGIAVAARDLSD